MPAYAISDTTAPVSSCRLVYNLLIGTPPWLGLRSVALPVLPRWRSAEQAYVPLPLGKATAGSVLEPDTALAIKQDLDHARFACLRVEA